MSDENAEREPEGAQAQATPSVHRSPAAPFREGEFDEDEDLFDFDEYVAARAAEGSDIDLDELLSALEDLPEELPAAAAAAENEAELAGAGAQVASVAGQAAPAARLAGQTVVVAGRSPLGRFGIAAIFALTALNAAVVLYSWSANKDLARSMAAIGERVIETTQEIRNETSLQLETLESIAGPVAHADPENYRTFERVEDDLERGDFAEARRKLYGLLSIADRLAPEVREDAEARALFLLADAMRDEAFARLGEAQP